MYLDAVALGSLALVAFTIYAACRLFAWAVRRIVDNSDPLRREAIDRRPRGADVANRQVMRRLGWLHRLVKLGR